MLLEVKDLGIAYGKAEPVVRHVSFQLEQGEILAIVGESGSGKTTVIRAIQHVLPGGGHIAEGQLLFEGKDTQKESAEMHRMLDGKEVSMIFQDSGAMMNPIRPIGQQFRDYLSLHGLTDEKEAHERMIDMLHMVRLPDPEQILKSYTFELSGGMRQRVGIAMAMAFHPKLLLADEPTSALDVTTQAAIVKEMMEVRNRMNTSIIIVTHNMGVAAYMADRIMVMRQGRMVEYGKAEDVIYYPKEDYTRMLLSAVPRLGGETA
ncbi:ABC transporter ATP-binding protein [Dialister sp.]|uniref:ABC transporter ATP-binding protein n=1 Tax=Dialister sp. TaxID=1955814 RepID=UPI003F04CF81